MTTHHTLDVPGARLYYEVQGSGSPIMLIGHPMDSTGFAALAQVLAEDHTVVSYDPRGFGKSTIDDRAQDAEPFLLADDVAAVLEAAGLGPADVFGSSGGAVTGLALAVRHAGLVRTFVAHEPPVALLLPEPDKVRAEIQEIYDTYLSSGIGAAYQRFFVFTGLAVRPQGDVGERPPPDAAAVASGERFFGHGVLPITLFEPDVAALRSGPVRVVPAGGVASRGQFAQRTAVALAERLGVPLAEFPGDHVGFLTDPKAFATRLREVLSQPAP